MSAPPLPEIFGNYALTDFVEVASPESISWLPQTVGWMWLGIALGLWLTRLSWLKLRHWYRNRYRREALLKLDQLQSASAAQLPTEINRLLKLTALAVWPRPKVAQLSGEPWPSFLNSACASAPFHPELAGLLAWGAYTGDVPSAASSAQLLNATRQWISEHRGPLDV